MNDTLGDLLRALAENPNDDGLRLMICDYLEENGNLDDIIIAEFIRSAIHHRTARREEDENPNEEHTGKMPASENNP